MKPVLDLPHDYDIALNVDLPAGTNGRLFEFNPGNGVPVRTRCLVEVHPEAANGWTGRFVGDYDEPPAISVVVSSPDPRRVCVVCSGRGYLVDIDQPQQFGLVECFPICSVRPIAPLDLIVFGNFTDLVAYARGGLLWKTPGLVSDELNIVDLDGELLTVDGLNTATGQTVRVAVDVRTGQLKV